MARLRVWSVAEEVALPVCSPLPHEVSGSGFLLQSSWACGARQLLLLAAVPDSWHWRSSGTWCCLVQGLVKASVVGVVGVGGVGVGVWCC